MRNDYHNFLTVSLHIYKDVANHLRQLAFLTPVPLAGATASVWRDEASIRQPVVGYIRRLG